MSRKDCKALFYSRHRSKFWMHSRSAREKPNSTTLRRTSRRSWIRGGFLHRDGEARPRGSTAMHSAAWQGADTRGGASTLHVTRKRNAQRSRRPSGSREPPSSPALAPSPASWLTCTHACFFFFLRIYFLNFLIEGNCFTQFCCFLSNLNMNQP